MSDFGGDGPRAVIGEGNINRLFAAVWRTSLVRHVDFTANFLGQARPAIQRITLA